MMPRPVVGSTPTEHGFGRTFVLLMTVLLVSIRDVTWRVVRLITATLFPVLFATSAIWRILSTATPVGPEVGQVAGGDMPVTPPVQSEAKTTVGVPVDRSIRVTSFEPVLATTASAV